MRSSILAILSSAVAAFICIPPTAGKAEVRTFTDAKGRALRGEMISLEGEVVTIKREDGQVFTVSISTFSADDQVYLRSHLKGAILVSKESPFINTLGMKFVPVPGTSVLFCIHETRKGDYRQYAKADPYWESPDFKGVPVSTGEDHPVANVNWYDAKNFCEWLSKKEERTYRLPTDREWSFAVGIGDLEDQTTSPQAKDHKVEGIYPWGSEWPPPSGTANLADAAFRKAAPGHGGIDGYEDGFATTAPVMSFKPNNLGLYDMAGNVFQWCEDWYDQERRVMRGSSYLSDNRRYTLSSHREAYRPHARWSHVGFRVVLEMGPPPSGPAATSMPVVVSPPPSPVGVAPSATPPLPLSAGMVPQIPTIPSGGKGVVFDRNWDTPFQGGSATLKDLSALLSSFAKPKPNLAPYPGLKIYEGVTYLMPLEDAKRTLGLTQRVVPKNAVGCPGFPVNSLFHYAFDVILEGHFTKLYLVTDKDDQVVCVQLVAEAPKKALVITPTGSTGWHTYNFINYRYKALTKLVVEHQLSYAWNSGWKVCNISKGDDVPAMVNTLRVDSALIDPGNNTSPAENGVPRNSMLRADWKPLEASRWYLPRPLAEQILYCIQKAAK